MPGIDGLQVLEEAKRVQPEAAAVIMTAYATVDTAVAAMKIGAYDYLVKPFDPEELSLMIQKIVTQQALVRENVLLRKVLKREYHFRDLISKSPAMQAVFDLARTAARSNSTILILGESGTGKELLARAIHAESPRAQGPFVAVSCAALTETLLESELFGHEKGAFTGAAMRRKGKFEMADGGTLFLDEIGDITPKLQLNLLRVLEDRHFFRVGGSESIHVDVRIIAATNRDLPEGGGRRLVPRGPVLPAQRDPDPPAAAARPARGHAAAGRALPRAARRRDEPPRGRGRHRRDGHPDGAHLAGQRARAAQRPRARDRRRVRATSSRRPTSACAARRARRTARPASMASLEDVERHHIGRVLQESAGNISQAARTLGIDRATLYNKLRKYNLRKDGEPEDRGRIDGVRL